MTNEILRAALRHAACGRPVFPCGRNKRPLVENGFKEASREPSVIADWWGRWPDAMIGMPTGPASGYWVLDVDRHGADGEQSLDELCGDRKLPHTPESLTPGGGRHLFFRHHPGLKNSAGKLGPGLDVRGDGGYVILPPSFNGVARYEWEASSDPDDGVSAVAAPDWLILKLSIESTDGAVGAVDGAVPEGQRNEWLFKLAASLRAKGLSGMAIEAALLEENTVRCRPPLESDEVLRIARSGSRYAPDGIARLAQSDGRVPDWPPSRSALAISDDELMKAKLTPRCIVKDYLYADVGQIIAPGGMGKTTMLLYEAVCISVGRPVWGMPVISRGWTLIVTKEDMRERLVARLREIMAVMDLSELERSRIMREVVILDVTGSALKLIFVNDGNIEETDMAQQLIDAYRDDPPACVVFDPTVSFGASETLVNDNEQGLVNVARHIVKAFDCCFRYVHHTGKGNARAKTTDQYSGRGGSALADGSRMTVVLAPWDERESLPPGCRPEPQTHLFKLERSKLSYSPPNLPTIWLKRNGFSFEHFVSDNRSAEAELKANADRIERFLISKVKDGELHSGRSLETQGRVLRMTRHDIRSAVDILRAQGRIFEALLPEDRRHGGRQRFLCPSEFSAQYGAVG